MRKESVVGQDSRYVGLDVHKETIAVAVADGSEAEPRFLGAIRNEPTTVLKLIRKLGPVERLSCCYEAGACGYGLQRQLARWGVGCVVVAPSLVPTKPGDKVKTDRRDAVKLARLLRSGDLTPVWVPDEAHEALRDLTRAREAAKQDLLRVRHRLSKLLLRLEIAPPVGVRRWSRKHRAWLGGLRLKQPLQQLVLEDALLAVDQVAERLERLTARLQPAALASPHAPLLAALQCLRGVGLITAVTLVAELGDLTRFQRPRRLMSYTGVVAREASSGGRQRRGSITKTGNAHVRSVLIEAAWHYRHPPRVGQVLKRRQKGQPKEITAIADKAQTRLHRRYYRLLARGKLPHKAVVAVGRELLGFVWAIGQQVAVPAASASGSARAAA
jgi:transposase